MDGQLGADVVGSPFRLCLHADYCVELHGCWDFLLHRDFLRDLDIQGTLESFFCGANQGCNQINGGLPVVVALFTAVQTGHGEPVLAVCFALLIESRLLVSIISGPSTEFNLGDLI